MEDERLKRRRVKSEVMTRETRRRSLERGRFKFGRESAIWVDWLLEKEGRKESESWKFEGDERKTRGSRSGEAV